MRLGLFVALAAGLASTVAFAGRNRPLAWLRPDAAAVEWPLDASAAAPAPLAMQDESECDIRSTACLKACRGDLSCMCESTASDCRTFRRCTNGHDGKHLGECRPGDGC